MTKLCCLESFIYIVLNLYHTLFFYLSRERERGSQKQILISTRSIDSYLRRNIPKEEKEII